MNYEDLLNGVQPALKAIKDGAAAVTKHQKPLGKNMENGNLPEIRKEIAFLKEQTNQLQAQVQEVESLVEGFDFQEYFVSGDFTRQMLDSCAEKKIDVVGEKGVYQMFPYKIKIVADAEHAPEVWQDRKKLNSFRPSYVAETIRTGQAKLYSANFNVQSFIADLADAYETARLRDSKKGVRDGATIDLTKIYKYLAPTARARKEYDAQAFAFDLARAYEAGPDAWVTKSGEKFELGPSRNNTGYRVLSSTGVESYISTLRHLVNAE